MIKAEYLFGVFSCIAVAMSYFVVTEAQQVVNDHDHAQFTHPEIRYETKSIRARIIEVDAAIDKISASVEHNSEVAAVIQGQNNDAHVRQEILLERILKKLDNVK